MLVRASVGQQMSDADEFQIFVIGSAAGGTSESIGVLICMRMLQAVGSSAVSAIGSGTLAVSDSLVITRIALIILRRIYMPPMNEVP